MGSEAEAQASSGAFSWKVPNDPQVHECKGCSSLLRNHCLEGNSSVPALLWKSGVLAYVSCMCVRVAASNLGLLLKVIVQGVCQVLDVREDTPQS